MADGWALASGCTAFVNLHAMGGLGNAMGVLVASKASETPLVVTAGQQDTRHLMTEPWLSGDLVALAEPVTKWAKELRRGEDVGQALRRAFEIARTPPCGPAFLSLPMDILDQEVLGPTPPASSCPKLGASPDSARLAEKLAGLDPDRIVVLLGDDLAAATSAGLVAFAEAGAFPVWGTQLTSRTAFPSAHPCWAGVLNRTSPTCAPISWPPKRSSSSAAERSSPTLIAKRSRCPRASSCCMSPTILRLSDASTLPTWRSSATSGRPSRGPQAVSGSLSTAKKSPRGSRREAPRSGPRETRRGRRFSARASTGRSRRTRPCWLFSMRCPRTC
jgi:hypothetical protein